MNEVFPAKIPDYITLVRVYENERIYIMQKKSTKETYYFATRYKHWIMLLCRWANEDSKQWQKLEPHMEFRKQKDWMVMEVSYWKKLVQWACVE
jgi:hypothetical protein